MNLYLKSFFICFFLLNLSSCDDRIRIASKRPILKVPDGNKDRMKKDLFSGTPENPKYWLSRMTVVKNTFDGGDLGFIFPGVQRNIKAGYFQFERDQVIFCNRVSKKFFEDEKTGNQVSCDNVYAWDIEHSAFRLAEIDGWTTNREEEDNYIPWDKKPYFKTKLNQTDLNSEFSSLIHPCWNLEKVSLNDESRVIEEDYISFIVDVIYKLKSKCSNKQRRNEENFTATASFKYSFKRVADPLKPDPNYTPYQLISENDPLRDKYGYFITVRPDFQSDKRNKNILYMNRWNPNKKHTFYFTKDYPEEYKYIAHGVICNTNKLFAKYGLNNYPLNGSCLEDGSVLPKKGETCSRGICFELKDNSGQEFGDIRYSFFHMTDIPIHALGYGPSNANPTTGEIINGTMLVGTRYLDYIIDETIEYLENEKTRYETSPILTSITQTLNILSSEDNFEPSHLDDRAIWTKTSTPLTQDRKLFNEFLSFFHFSNPRWSRFTQSNLENSGSNSPSLEKLFSPLEKLENNNNLNYISNNLQHVTKDFKQFIQEEKRHQEENFTNLFKNEIDFLNPSLDLSDPTQGTFFPKELLQISVLGMAKSGMSKEEMKEKILFNLISHEFGHVLNLRHNFYGSVDSKHHHEHAKTSSVMDYMNLNEEIEGPSEAFFGPYDEAALIYAYSDGKIDLSEERKSKYLFCTDEDRELNFLCKRWDYGTTVSEVTQSLIENYDQSYIFKNFRNNRAYWSDRNYIYRTIKTMYEIKRPLGLLDLFNSKKRNMSSVVNEEGIKMLEKDIKQAVKLSLSFYNSLIQLDDEREWFNKYHPVSGSLESIGIFYDKLFAIFFLMNDIAISENPNDPVYFTSYLPYANDPDLKDIIKIIMENTLTQRVDNIPGFTSLAQYLYAENSANYYNTRLYPEALEKIGVRCYTQQGLAKRFKVNFTEDTKLETLFTIKITPEYLEDSYYKQLLTTDPFNGFDQTHLQLGVIYRNGKYYTSLSEINTYSFSMIDRLIQNSSNDARRRDTEEKIYTLYLMYNSLKESPFSSIECDSGAQ